MWTAFASHFCNLHLPAPEPRSGVGGENDRRGPPQRRTTPEGPQQRGGPGACAGLPFAEAGLAGSAGHPASGVSHKDAVARSATPTRTFTIYAR